MIRDDWHSTCKLWESSRAIFFSRSVVSDSLLAHGQKHNRFPCPSPSPRTCSNSCPLSQWCHPTGLLSVIPFSSCLHSFPELGSFLMSRLFASGGQSIGPSASVLPMNIHDRFPLGLTGLISSLQSKRLSRVLFNTTVQKYQFFDAYPLWSNSHIHTWKNHSLTIWTFVSKVMPMLFNMLFRFVITFLPKSKHHLISWLPSPSAMILEPRKIV